MPIRRLYIADAAGVTDTPVSTGVGALVITGYAPTVNATAHISVATGSGALAITGYAPTVSADGSVSVTTGTGEITLTGYAPTITVPVLVDTGVGTLTITGYAPTVGVSQSVTTGVGALVLTGYGPTISVTANTTVTPDAATLAIAGYAPSVSKTDHVSVATGVGALTITGYAPTVQEIAASPTVTVGAAELLLNTYAPIVVNSGDVVARAQAAGGRSKSRRRRVILRDRTYEVDERDIPALIESVLRDTKPPGTAEPVDEAPKPRKTPRKAAKTDQNAPESTIVPVPSVDMVEARIEALRAELQARAEADVARMLDRVASRVLMEMADEEDAIVALLLA